MCCINTTRGSKATPPVTGSLQQAAASVLSTSNPHLVLSHSHSHSNKLSSLLSAHCATSRHLCATARGQSAAPRDWRALCRKPLSSRHLASLPVLPLLDPHLALNTLRQAFNRHLHPFTARHRSPVEKSCRVCVGCRCSRGTKTFLLCIIAAEAAAGKVSFVAIRPMLLVGGVVWCASPANSLSRQKMSFSPWGVNLLGRHPGSLNGQRKRSAPNTEVLPRAICHFGGNLITFTL